MNIRTLLFAAVSPCAMLPQAVLAQAGSTTGTDIVVTASPLGQHSDETATPVLTLTDDELVHRRQATLGETLAGQPGINFDNFGGGAGRPVVRGQTAPRVQTLSDSANIQDASTISPDHAVTTEPLLLRGIEVLRGPAALLYGGGAIGGAINLLDEKVPTALPAGGISAAVEGRLATADDERSIVGGVTVGVGPFALRVEGVDRQTNDYDVPGGRVAGSYNDTSTLTVGGSWIGTDGYLGLAYTRQRSTYGLPGHSHEYESCHPHGTSLHCGAHDDHDDHDHGEGGDHDEIPFVNLRSNRFDIRGEYRDPLPGIERVRLRAAFTDYAHDELEHGEVSTTFRNKARDARLEITHKPIAGLRGVIGVQHSHSEFSSIGAEQFLPPSDTTNTALFAMETFQAGPVRLELAARQEWQKVSTTGGREARHQPFSISGAAIWDLGGDYSVALSLARSQRAPNVQELYSNTLQPYRGVHLATNTWEIGTPGLGKETARSIDLTFRKTKGATTFTISGYHQAFSNYIFARTLDRFEAFRLVRYDAADATFTGIDGEVRHQFTSNLAASVFGDYVRAKIKHGGGDLPRIPAGRIGGRLDGSWGPFSADAEYYRVFEQGRVADFETATPGYDTVNLTLAYHIDLGTRAKAEVFLRGTNLTNALAYNHASFIKDASPLRGRNVVFGIRAAY